MTRHPNARRAHRDPTHEDDELVARALAFIAWAKANTRALIVTGAVLVLAVAAGLYYRNYQATVRAQAATQLASAKQTVASGNQALALRDLETLVVRFDGTQAAAEGRILLAQLRLEEGNAAQAIEALRPLAKDVDGPLGTPAAFLLASAHEAADQVDEAQVVYLRIADQARLGYYRREALAQAARLREDSGEPAEAAELYERLLGMTGENSPERAIYQLRLAEAKTRAASS